MRGELAGGSQEQRAWDPAELTPVCVQLVDVHLVDVLNNHGNDKGLAGRVLRTVSSSPSPFQGSSYPSPSALVWGKQRPENVLLGRAKS